MRHSDSANASLQQVNATGSVGTSRPSLVGDAMKILIVEDDSATATFMQMAFGANGDDVETASSVADAIRQLDANPPDVILTDLTFGRDGQTDADGFSLVDWVRNAPQLAHIGVLAVSGAGSPDVLRAVDVRGFDGFVAKPVDVALLVERVQRLGAAVDERRHRGLGAVDDITSNRGRAD